jgi:xanthine dehydrogenase molybdopterin-binding subunit B
MNDMSNKWIGKNTIRPDGAEKVTGRAAYAADTNMPGMIWGKVLRSPHPHARIISINTAKAEAHPGVKAVVTHKDVVDFPLDKSVMLGIQDMRWMCRNIMAREKALFHGHPIAAIAAISEKVAAEALQLIEVEYEVLPWVIDAEDAIKPDAPILHDFIKFDGKPSNIAGKLEHKLGDVDAGFAEADVVVEILISVGIGELLPVAEDTSRFTAGESVPTPTKPALVHFGPPLLILVGVIVPSATDLLPLLKTRCSTVFAAPLAGASVPKLSVVPDTV